VSIFSDFTDAKTALETLADADATTGTTALDKATIARAASLAAEALGVLTEQRGFKPYDNPDALGRTGKRLQEAGL
jgi:hypothetical protein